MEYIKDITPDIIEYCCKYSPENLAKYVDNSVMTYEFAKRIVTDDSDNFKYVSYDIHTVEQYLELCKITCSHDLTVVSEVNKEYLSDMYNEFIKYLLNFNISTIKYVDYDYNLYKENINKSPQIIRYISKSNPDYFELCSDAVRLDTSIIYNIDDDYEYYEDLCIIAIEIDSHVYRYINMKSVSSELCYLVAMHAEAGFIKSIENHADFINLCNYALDNGLNDFSSKDIQSISNWKNLELLKKGY